MSWVQVVPPLMTLGTISLMNSSPIRVRVFWLRSLILLFRTGIWTAFLVVKAALVLIVFMLATIMKLIKVLLVKKVLYLVVIMKVI